MSDLKEFREFGNEWVSQYLAFWLQYNEDPRNLSFYNSTLINVLHYNLSEIKSIEPAEKFDKNILKQYGSTKYQYISDLIVNSDYSINPVTSYHLKLIEENNKLLYCEKIKLKSIINNYHSSDNDFIIPYSVNSLMTKNPLTKFDFAKDHFILFDHDVLNKTKEGINVENLINTELNNDNIYYFPIIRSSCFSDTKEIIFNTAFVWIVSLKEKNEDIEKQPKIQLSRQDIMIKLGYLIFNETNQDKKKMYLDMLTNIITEIPDKCVVDETSEQLFHIMENIKDIKKFGVMQIYGNISILDLIKFIQLIEN